MPPRAILPALHLPLKCSLQISTSSGFRPTLWSLDFDLSLDLDLLPPPFRPPFDLDRFPSPFFLLAVPSPLSLEPLPLPFFPWPFVLVCSAALTQPPPIARLSSSRYQRSLFRSNTALAHLMRWP